MKFHFLFHTGGELVFEASSCKHYSSHAALTDATLVLNTTNITLIPLGKKFLRFNLALNGHLLGMWPEGDEVIE